MVTTDRRSSEFLLGQAYNWPASRGTQAVRCSNVLADLVLRGAIPTWRVAPTGRTRFDAWPTLPAADQHVTLIGDRDMPRGTRMFSVKGSVAAMLPGATADGATISAVQFKETGESVEAKTWDATAPNEDSLYRRLILRLFPWMGDVGVDAASGALSVKSAAGKLALEGGGAAVMRAGDLTGYWYAELGPNGVVGLWFSPSKGETAWAPDTVYAPGAKAQNGLDAYGCVKPGTSASSGGPTGTGTGIADGTDGLVWNYLYSVTWTQVFAAVGPPLTPGIGTPLPLGGPGSKKVSCG